MECLFGTGTVDSMNYCSNDCVPTSINTGLTCTFLGDCYFALTLNFDAFWPSVMDVLNLWSDDPEEVLLDLGFGVEEPDITGRIPARFINNQSQARGINLQVFLEAQKNRMDIENPDVRSMCRMLHEIS